jgi:hypothetical protein
MDGSAQIHLHPIKLGTVDELLRVRIVKRNYIWKYGSERASIAPGLPDGIFTNQKIPIWVNFEGPLNLWYFGHIYHRVGILCQEKSGNPALHQKAVFLISHPGVEMWPRGEVGTTSASFVP